MPLAYMKRLKKCLEHIQCSNGADFITYEAGVSGCLDIYRRAREEGNDVYFIGNGGSAGIAVHMTADYFKNGKLRTVSLFNPSTLTCLGNDLAYEFVFSEQIKRMATCNDILTAISSSGNSSNILQAVAEARKKKCQVITLSGFADDNKLRNLGDWNFYVPSHEYGIVESIHHIILQEIVDLLKD